MVAVFDIAPNYNIIIKNFMIKIREYHLWLMPSGDVYNKLNHLISRLSKKYSSPNFEPHVTLIGKLIGSEQDVILKTLQLTGYIKPFTIKLKKIDYRDEYFKCLFITAEETEDLMKANLKASEIFNRKDSSKYFPHLSIMYGNFPVTMKKKIISEIGEIFNLNFKVKNMALLSNGKPKNWHKVKEFTLE